MDSSNLPTEHPSDWSADKPNCICSESDSPCEAHDRCVCGKWAEYHNWPKPGPWCKDCSIRIRRAPVQGTGPYWTPPDNWMRKKYPTKEPGSISWREHLEVWEKYAIQYGRSQSAERIAERSGFGYFEATELLGRPLTTWIPDQK